MEMQCIYAGQFNVTTLDISGHVCLKKIYEVLKRNAYYIMKTKLFGDRGVGYK